MTLWNIVYLIGIMVACVGVMQLLPLGLSVFFSDGYVLSLALSCAASVLAGLLLVRAGSGKRRTILSNSEALGCVGLCWIAATCAGALPYVATGFMHPVDAWFESVSGFTTTGSSVLSDIEALPQSLLFWRSLTQWCGGMGIIVLSLAVLPQLVASVSAVSLGLLLAGGIAYTVGIVFFALGKNRKYMHCIWHIFVLAGSICQFVSVLMLM